MEDPEPFSALQERNENNNVDFKNILNGSVLSSLSKTLDLALLENNITVNLEYKRDSSVPCDPATFSPHAATVGSSDDIREVSSIPPAIATEEQSKGPRDLQMQEEKAPESGVSSSSGCDKSSTSLIPLVDSHPEVSPSETRKISNKTTSVNGTTHKCSEAYYRPASPTTDDRGSGKLSPDITDGERSSASTPFSTVSFEKRLQDSADKEQTSVATSSSSCSSRKLLTEPTTASSTNSSACSSEKTLPAIIDTERTPLATSFSTCTSQKPQASLTDTQQPSVAASFSNGLTAEFSPPVAQQPSMSCLASSSNSKSASSAFPRSSSLSGPNSFDFSAEALDYDSSGDSTDYEEAFDWDISGNIEYYDFKDREKVRLSRIVPREQDAGTSGMDFATETSFMKASSPLKRKRTHDDEPFGRQFSNPSCLRTGKNFKSSEVGNHFHPSCSSASSSQPSLSIHPPTVTGTSNSFDDLILSLSSSPSNKPSSSKLPSVSLSKVPTTYMVKAPSFSTRASKPPLRGGAAASRLANRTPSFKLRVGINSKSSPSISSSGIVPSKSRIVINSKASSISSGSITPLPPVCSGSNSSLLPTDRGSTASLSPSDRSSNALLPLTDRGSTASLPPTGRGNTASLPPTGRGNTASLPLKGRGSTASLPPAGRGNTASLPTKGRGRIAACPDSVSSHPNRARLRKVLLDVMGRHKRARGLEAEKAKKFAICRKELLGDILKQLHLLQAQCVERLM